MLMTLKDYFEKQEQIRKSVLDLGIQTKTQVIITFEGDPDKDISATCASFAILEQEIRTRYINDIKIGTAIVDYLFNSEFDFNYIYEGVGMGYKLIDEYISVPVGEDSITAKIILRLKLD